MKLQLLREISIILGLYLLGELCAYFLDMKYFGGLIGMLFLLVALHLKLIKVDDIRHIASFLLGHMPFFFIPAGVSVMVNYYLMDGFVIEITLLVMISTAFVMAITGVLVQYFVGKEVLK